MKCFFHLCSKHICNQCHKSYNNKREYKKSRLISKVPKTATHFHFDFQNRLFSQIYCKMIYDGVLYISYVTILQKKVINNKTSSVCMGYLIV